MQNFFIALAVFMVMLSALAYRVHTLEKQAGEYQSTIRELNRAVAASNAVADANAKSLRVLKEQYDALEKDRAAKRAAVQKAVEAVPDWSHQSVPSGVSSALRVQYTSDGN